MLEGNLLNFKAVLHNWQQYECLAWFVRCRDGTGKLRANKANELTLNELIGLIIHFCSNLDNIFLVASDKAPPTPSLDFLTDIGQS